MKHPISDKQPTTPAAMPSSKEGWTLKEGIVYGVLGLAGVGGSLWLGHKLYRELVSNKEENKSFEDGSPATIAKQIKMAFENDGWWGTDVAALRTALRSVASPGDWNKVVKSYQKLYGSNLLKDLADKLQSSEYNEMLQIIHGKSASPNQALTTNQYNAWAKRLKAAFDKSYGFLPGTDEPAITAALQEMPTQNAFIQVGIAYKRLFGTNLMDELLAESQFGEYERWVKIITSKRKH